jgi:hypothetical protein
MHRRSLLAVVALLALPLVVRSSAAQDAGPANLSGAWKLNPEASTQMPEPSERPDGGQRRGGGGGSTDGRGGRGGPGGMMGGLGRPSEDDLIKMQAFMRRLREAPERLTIVKDVAPATRFAFTEGTGSHWAVTAGGKKEVRLTGEGELELTAKYEGDALVVVESLDKRSITYRYRVLREGDRDLLEVTLTPKGARPGGRGGGGRPDAGGGSGGEQRLPAPPAIVRIYDRME